MSAISPQPAVLRVATVPGEPLNLRLEAGGPTEVRIEVQPACSCESGALRRPGSYVDTDFGNR